MSAYRLVVGRSRRVRVGLRHRPPASVEPYLDEEEIRLLCSTTAPRCDRPPLHEWASCVTAAITHRDRLSADEVRTFVAPFADLLPDLAILLREDA